jgi:hypothetical protein
MPQTYVFPRSARLWRCPNVTIPGLLRSNSATRIVAVVGASAFRADNHDREAFAFDGVELKWWSVVDDSQREWHRVDELVAAEVDEADWGAGRGIRRAAAEDHRRDGDPRH